MGAWEGGQGHSAQLSLEQGVEGGVRVWELGELEEGREGPWIEVKPWGTLARCGRERGPDLSYRRPSSPLSRGQEIPSFPSRGKVDISPPSAWG